MSETTREIDRMLARMNPLLCEDEFVFCATDDRALAARAQVSALGSFNEDEGLSLILESGVAAALGFDVGFPMRRIALTVNSALDGVGLTAAVAAYRHDHVFVPSDMAERALAILKALQSTAEPRGTSYGRSSSSRTRVASCSNVNGLAMR